VVSLNKLFVGAAALKDKMGRTELELFDGSLPKDKLKQN